MNTNRLSIVFTQNYIIKNSIYNFVTYKYVSYKKKHVKFSNLFNSNKNI